MKKPIISVIVPVYNVAAYLPECLDSILAQTFRETEIILVDDGSTDSSGQICDAFAKRDERIRVLHQLNRGVSAARNRGIDLSQGAYLSFVDSDDYLAPDMLESMYALLTAENAEVAVCGVYRVRSRTISPQSKPFRGVMSGREFFRMVLIGHPVSVTMCDKLFRRECFARVRFPEGKTTEDGYIAVDLYPCLHRVAIDLQPKYYYRLREGSISVGTFSQQDNDIVKAYARCLAMVKEQYPECLSAAKMRYFRSYFVLYDKMAAAGAPQAEQIRKTLLGFAWGILTNPYIFATRKAGFLVLCLSRRLYRSTMIRYENAVNQRALK